MSKRNQGRSGPLANTAKSPDDLFEMDEKILGQINRADASMQTALPTSIYDLDPDPTQPRRVVPSAVRKAVPAGTRAPDLLEWWAVMVYQERHGYKPADSHQTHASLRSVVAGDLVEREGEPGLIEAALLRVAHLAADIRARGKLIHPIHITSAGRIITGERRWLAHHLLTRYEYPGFDKIMAVESEYDVWVQASENNQRSDLNAIGRARQFAILLMDLLRRDGADFEPLRAFDDEQDYYAQVADSRLHRIPTGGLNQIMGAMGVKGRQTLSDYRRLLSLPKDIWVIADDENWAINDLLKIVRSSDDLDDPEQESDGDPAPAAPVGESAAIPNIPSSDPPAPVDDAQSNVKLLDLEGVPESVSWWGAYKDLARDLPEHLFFIRARNDFFALREDAKTLDGIVPSTMPGCHFTNTEFGMAFFCPQAVIDYVAESHLVAICDMRRKESVNDFWYTHMVKNRQSKPAAATPAAPPQPEPQRAWRPNVGDQVVTPNGQVGKVTFIINKDKVSVRTPRSVGVYEIAQLDPYVAEAAPESKREPEPQPATDEQDAPRFALPFTAEPDTITAGVQLVMDTHRRMVASWRPSPAHPDESVQWLQGMVALTNGTMAHPQAQALFRVIEYLGGLAGADYFPAQAMADLEMLRSFVERAAGQMQKGGG